MQPPKRPPPAAPRRGMSPAPVFSGATLRPRDPYRDLAEQRGQKLLGPALAPKQDSAARDTEVASLRVLAERATLENRHGDAETLLARALECAPGHAPTRHAYALALFHQHKAPQAIAELTRLLERDRGNAGYRILLASCLAMIGDFDQAIDLYSALLKEQPRYLDLWRSYAQALTSAGRGPEAERAFRAMLDISPFAGDAYWGLGTLSAADSPPADIEAMRACLASSGPSEEGRAQIHYALGLALEKSGIHAESFAHYAEGARLWRRRITYSADDNTALTRRIERVFTAALFATHEGHGCPDPAPIFIVGMPRAGSTLIEQILASHSEVEGLMELPELDHIVTGRDNSRETYPDWVPGLGEDDLLALGKSYLDRIRPYRKTQRRFFIDKMPGNFLYAGLIRLILPNAKIIDARREPMASCFAAFRKSFGLNQAFSCDLTELGCYYADYAGLMAQYDAALPGWIYRQSYERLVADTEAEIGRLLAYCGLGAEPACLRFWEQRRAVSTVSATQVRRPIYSSALESWRPYEAWLGPLRSALGPLADGKDAAAA